MKLSIFNIARTIRQAAIHFYENMNSYVQMMVVGGVGVALYARNCGVLASTLGIFVAYLATGGWRYTWVFLQTLPRDMTALSYFIKLRWTIRQAIRNETTVAKIFKGIVETHPGKTAFISGDRRWSFREVDEYTNAVANYFYGAGYRQGDVIALYLENRFEVVGLWLGLSKIGVISALINYNLRGDQLLHCFTSAEVKAIVFGTEMSQAIKDILPNINNNMELYNTGPDTTDLSSVDLDGHLEKCPRCPPPHVPVSVKDKLIFIFTSGTTGLPKAAIITQTRYMYMSFGIHYTLRIRADDILYITLPLYHVAGAVLGVGQAIIGGSTIVLAKKFSASGFWTDCIKYRCTIAQYIGEICRYLLAQPPRPVDTQHSVRLMYGNGLRSELWEPFQTRFRVKQLGEHYGATEGNCNIVNMFNQPGAVGFTSRIAPSVYPITLILVDKDTGEPLRDKHGVCIKAQPGEQGELVGKITRRDPCRQFDGYVDQSATNEKIATNVFTAGDSAFRTGDILEMDELGFLYFRDRTGDTFRWKGENVSTTEVEGIVSRVVGHKDSVVYGVQVFDLDGKAGMAAIACEPADIHFPSFEKQIEKALPAYARPVFLRFCRFIDTTGTFKLRKINLREEGFHPDVITDPIFFFNTSSRKYEQLTPLIYKQLAAGKIRI